MKINLVVMFVIGLEILNMALAKPISKELAKQDQVPGKQCSWKFCMAEWQQSFSINFLKAAVFKSPKMNFVFSPRSLYIGFLPWYFLCDVKIIMSKFENLLSIPHGQVIS